MFDMLPILYPAGLKNKYASEHLLNQSAKVLPQITGLRIWSPSRKFGHGHEMNLKGLLYLVLLN